ncbi:MAG: acetyl-CoA decarbonylase/synthase complex subunit gamma, partial [Planctomycetes bacterium]|nr:acetyl-CoA decarbonylase/synthase complex subunit gamma [Planctomycetota bacterium]
FVNPAGVAVTLNDDLDSAALAARVDKINKLKFFRVGTDIEIDCVAVVNKSGSADKFVAAAKAAAGTRFGLILSSKSADNLKAALAVCATKKPLIHAADASNFAAMAALAKESKCPLAVAAPTLDALAELTEKVQAAGVVDLVLDLSAPKTADVLQNLTKARRAALKKNFRPLGFPAMVCVQAADPWEETAQAATYLAKYASLIVVNGIEPWQIMPLLTVRMNIYTDPQKPVQVEPKLYTVGEVTPNSPVMFTTNFSLTYYSVESDVEASRIPSYVIAVDTEGTSVLTAYSGDKLNETAVAKAMADTKIAEKVKHRKLIIPGYVAVMSGKLEEATGWEILVGPKESSMIPTYLKTTWR